MTFRLTLFLTGAFLLGDSLVWAAEGIISKVANPSGSACNLKFPAIREETLSGIVRYLRTRRTATLSTFTDPATTIR
jgi:hypothetical protein